MKRYHQEINIIRRNHLEHLKAVHGWPKKPVDCICDFQAGRFRKKDAYDCGNTRCRVCHYEKYFGRDSARGRTKSRGEVNNTLRYQEGIQMLEKD